MTEVFISYARDDRAAAQEIARMLELDGFTVWWDRDLAPGNEFSDVIEQTLDGAKAIIVLWSEASRKSHWVRDEAAVGRDRNRLIPVALDATPPPLGFRQIHTITITDLRREPRTHAALSASLGALCGRAPAPSAAPVVVPPPVPVDKPIQQILQEEKRQRSFVASYWLMGLPVALLLAGATTLLAQVAETYPNKNLLTDFVLGFLLASISLGLGRLFIVIGRRAAKRKSVRYFDQPTVTCFIFSMIGAALIGGLAVVSRASGPGDAVLVAVFMIMFFFPVCALVSIVIGILKGAERVGFENGR